MRYARCSLFTAVLLLTPATARANAVVTSIAAMIPSVWFSLPGLSIFVSALALLGIVTLVEAAILAWAFRQRWYFALMFSFVANLVTAVLGVMLVPAKSIGLIVFLIAFFCATWAAGSLFKWREWRLLAFLVLFPAATISILFIDLPTVPGMLVQFYAAMLYSFLLTLFFEAAVFAWLAESRQPWRWSLAANGATYLLLFAAVLMCGYRSGSFIALEGPRGQLRQWAQSTKDRQETIRRFEEFFLWEESGSKRPKSMEGFQWPYTELSVVTAWAKRGHKSDAHQLYSVIASHRPRHITGYGAEIYDHFWEEAETALKE